MERIKKQIIDFTLQFYNHFNKKETSELLAMLSDDVSINGVYMDESKSGKEAIAPLLTYMTNGLSIQSEKLTKERCKISKIESNLYKVELDLAILQQDTNMMKVPYYAAIFVCIEPELKVKRIFFSLGDKLDDTIKEVITTNSLKKIIKENTTKLKTVNNNIKTLYNTVPGGIFKCLFDEYLTLIEMSDGFLSIIGYTREEVKAKYHNSLKALIHPEDLQRIMKEVKIQLCRSHIKEIEYRLLHKNGSYIWVLDKGQLFEDDFGRECFHCIVVDISVEKAAIEDLRLSVERNQIIMNQTNDVIFEWDMMKDEVYVTNNWYKAFKRLDDNVKVSVEKLLKSDMQIIHKDDIEIIEKAIREMRVGSPYVEFEIRLLNKFDHYLWCRIRMTIQFMDNGKPVKGIGIIIDIDDVKRESQNLLEQATRDSLTGLFNKSATQTLIQKHLNQHREEVCALMIVDIDNFKIVNDTKGHLYGDAVLSDISKTIKEVFRSSDILGRIGGDEFMVFIKNIDHIENAKDNAFKVLNSITHLRSLDGLSKSISCSIGISMFPYDGVDFTSLYQNADYALYQAKNDGKNRFSIYNEKNIQEYLLIQKAPYSSSINADIDSNQHKSTRDTLSEYVFRILYRSENVTQAIETILEIVGNKYDVSRAYIFENNEDDTYCINTFEWCNTNINPEIDNLQAVHYEKDLGDTYMENFNEHSIFYCPDIKELHPAQYEMLNAQGIKSMLQCAIIDNGKFKGFIGFDENVKNRYWTQEQIDALTLICEIVGTFLLKHRKEESLVKENKTLLSILDTQNAFIYIIDAITYELLYINKKTLSIAPNSETGVPCYKLFVGGSQPCDVCPARALVSKEKINQTVEFYNEKLDIWTDADASLIKFNGKDAILLVCHDINRFKK